MKDRSKLPQRARARFPDAGRATRPIARDAASGLAQLFTIRRAGTQGERDALTEAWDYCQDGS